MKRRSHSRRIGAACECVKDIALHNPAKELGRNWQTF
jgi:hypothetical protein